MTLSDLSYFVEGRRQSKEKEERRRHNERKERWQRAWGEGEERGCCEQMWRGNTKTKQKKTVKSRRVT